MSGQFDRGTNRLDELTPLPLRNENSMAKDLSPIEVMELLNEVYTQFDIIAKQNGVYKVETIGDSYSECQPTLHPSHPDGVTPEPRQYCQLRPKFPIMIKFASKFLVLIASKAATALPRPAHNLATPAFASSHHASSDHASSHHDNYRLP